MNAARSTKSRGPLDLVNGPLVRTMFLLAIPALGSNLLQSLNASINAVWVGRLLGAGGLAATANANLVMFLVLSLVFGFGMAATILIGQSMGRGDLASMRRALGAGLTFFVFLGTAASALGWLASPTLLEALGTPPEIMGSALAYLRVMFLGLPFALLTVYLGMALRGVGDALTPLLLQVPGMIVDIALNPVLIDGLAGAPRLGIAGSGLATLIANLVSFLLLLAYTYLRDLPIRLRGRELRYLVPKPELLRFILLKGVPMGLQMIVVSGSAIVLLGFVNSAGTAAVAAYGASTQLWTYIQMPSIGVAMAVSAMAAQNIGAGRWDRVSELVRVGMWANVALTGAVVIAILLFDDPILTLFLPQSPSALAIAKEIALLVTWSFVPIGATLILSSVVRANGATIVPLAIMSVAYLPCRIGMILILRPWLGIDAVWWSFSFGAAISLILTYGYFRYGGWRDPVVLASPKEAEEVVQSEADPAGRAMPNL